MKLDEIDKAETCCQKSVHNTPDNEPANRRDSKALLIRNYELQGKDVASVQALADSFPDADRGDLWPKYSYLWPGAWGDHNLPPKRGLQKVVRRRWLNALELSTREAALGDAITSGDLEATKVLLASTASTEKALHVAALFGETEIAKLLIEKGSKSDDTCKTAKLSKGDTRSHSHNHCVTPLHLAIAAQQHDMIRLLDNDSACWDEQETWVSGSRVVISAPPRWLFFEEWLRLIGCTDPMEVVRTVDTLRALSPTWPINSPIDFQDRTILDCANGLRWEFASDFKNTLVKQLRSRGAKTKAELR